MTYGHCATFHLFSLEVHCLHFLVVLNWNLAFFEHIGSHLGMCVLASQLFGILLVLNCLGSNDRDIVEVWRKNSLESQLRRHYDWR